MEFVGRFRGAQLSVELTAAAPGEYRGTIYFAAQQFPLRAAARGGELAGTFDAGGQRFDFSARFDGALLVLSSGGAGYALEREGAAPNPLAAPPPANPLAPAPTPAPAPASAEAGELYRHPTGVTLRLPPAWRAQDSPLGVQLVPPDLAATPQGPTELYLVTGQPAAGIDRAEDPRVIGFLDQSTMTTFPFLRRSAAPEPFAGGALRLRYQGKNPMNGLDVISVVLVRVLRAHAIAVVALGDRARVEPRLPLVEATFASLAWGEAERDPALVGLWHYWHYRPGKQVSGETRKQIQLAPDGSAAMASNTETIGNFHGRDQGGHETWWAGLAAQGGNQLRGTWSAGGGRLFLSWSDGTSAAFQYRIEGAPPQRRIVLTAPGSDDRQEWTEQPIRV